MLCDLKKIVMKNSGKKKMVAFSSLAMILGECSTIHSLPLCVCVCVRACVRACVRVCVCFEVEISSHTLIPLFVPGSIHNGSAS